VPLDIDPTVADAIRANRPVVALESTIFSHLGLPSPHNRRALDRCVAVIRAGGAVPAVCAVVDGRWRVGLDEAGVDAMLAGDRKVAERDLAVAAAQGWRFGATTVSATVALCHRAGIRVFATGGIGGVHRGAEITGDVSADLDALASHPVITVCAGAKAFLDLPRTLEHLETLGVPVLGWRHDWFPAFYTRTSGLAVPHRVETAGEVARTLAFRSRPSSGVLLTVPIPEADALDPAVLDEAMATALDEAAAAGVSGSGVTPFVLARIGRATQGRSLPANLALAEHNAAVATEVALAVTAT
jgi:pseudouridine-5'-phosphate glycosidase